MQNNTDAVAPMQTVNQIDAGSAFRGGWIAVVFLLLAIIAGIAPTLTWLEFASGSENLNAATVLEMHRDGHWLMPTLNNQPRLAKPPLTAWTSAALVPHDSLALIDSPDRAVRDAAYDRFAFNLRWPALALACGLVLSVYWLGRVMESARFGWSAAVVCASSILFLRFCRSATTDIQLACWVGLANALFASLVFTKVRLWKLILIGVSLGLAALAKGPVAFAQTCAPWLLFALLDAPTRARTLARPRITLGATLLVTVLTLAISVPWFAYVVLRNASAMTIWWKEVTREGATTLEPDVWFSYVSIFLLVMPWTVFFIAGLGTAIQERKTSTSKFALCLLVLPIALMSLAKDKNDRYLVPLLPAASVIVAFALRQQFRASREQNAGDKLLRNAQWMILALAMVGVPLLGASGAVTMLDGSPWFSYPFTAALLVVFGGLLAGLYVWSSRTPGVIVPATLVCMLVAQVPMVWGYRESGGNSELKPIADVIRQHAPNATIWFYDPPDHTKLVPADLSIYLNRPVRTARDETMLNTADDGAVVVILQRKGKPEPVVPGWTPIDKRGQDGRNWWALRRDHTAPTTQP
jgi:4-amino-4-deoxy-L-arabinose transferase-like glycosyltransferase